MVGFMRTTMLLLLFVLASCGFQPMYGNTSYRQALTGVTVADIKGREGQLFKQKLEDQINPAAEGSDRRYVFVSTLNIHKIAVAIDQNRRVSRYNIDITANYELKDASGKTVHKDKLHALTSLNVVPSEFATYVAEQDATDRALSELAIRTSQKLASLIAAGF